MYDRKERKLIQRTYILVSTKKITFPSRMINRIQYNYPSWLDGHCGHYTDDSTVQCGYGYTGYGYTVFSVALVTNQFCKLI